MGVAPRRSQEVFIEHVGIHESLAGTPPGGGRALAELGYAARKVQLIDRPPAASETGADVAKGDGPWAEPMPWPSVPPALIALGDNHPTATPERVRAATGALGAQACIRRLSGRPRPRRAINNTSDPEDWTARLDPVRGWPAGLPPTTANAGAHDARRRPLARRHAANGTTCGQPLERRSDLVATDIESAAMAGRTALAGTPPGISG